jgi:hypothetical protein
MLTFYLTLVAACYSESMTISLFVLSGAVLEATVQFEGPLGSDIETEIDSGKALQKAITEFDHGNRHDKILSMVRTVDFEHLNVNSVGGLEAKDDDENPFAKVPEEESAEERRERRATERKKALESRQHKETSRIKQKKKIREEGEPFQQTMKAKVKGWYRYCVKAKSQVVVEIDFRKESEMGGLNANGFVRTYEEMMMEEEEKSMEEDTAAEEGIKDEDFADTRAKLKALRRLLADIQNKQQQERHRLVLHTATNEHSHSRMVLSSLLETLLFLAVTSFQVYTIQRWFKGAPVLGR